MFSSCSPAAAFAAGVKMARGSLAELVSPSGSGRPRLDDRNDVDPDREDREAAALDGRQRVQPEHRQAAQPPELLPVHRLERRPELRSRPRLDLTDDEGAGVPGDDVDLAAGTAPVAIEDGEASVREVAARELLAVPPERPGR